MKYFWVFRTFILLCYVIFFKLIYLIMHWCIKCNGRQVSTWPNISSHLFNLDIVYQWAYIDIRISCYYVKYHFPLQWWIIFLGNIKWLFYCSPQIIYIYLNFSILFHLRVSCDIKVWKDGAARLGWMYTLIDRLRWVV